jgi:hypothetical protein
VKTWFQAFAFKCNLYRYAKENGMAQLGQFVAGEVSDSESESTYQKNYVY